MQSTARRHRENVRRPLIASAGFGIAIATIYFTNSHEPIGTVLLGIMAAALLFAAGYAVLAERDADLDGDRESEGPADAAGEDLGIFTTHSAWPILIAVSVLFVLIGALWSPLVAALAIISLVLCLWRMGRESNRI